MSKSKSVKDSFGDKGNSPSKYDMRGPLLNLLPQLQHPKPAQPVGNKMGTFLVHRVEYQPKEEKPWAVFLLTLLQGKNDETIIKRKRLAAAFATEPEAEAFVTRPISDREAREEKEAEERASAAHRRFKATDKARQGGIERLFCFKKLA